MKDTESEIKSVRLTFSQCPSNMSASPPNRSANIGDWELMMGGQWSNLTDLPSAENNFCKDRHVWRQNGWHKWVVLCIYCPSCPPCCCKGSPTDLPSTGNIFQRHVSRPNWLTYMSSNSFPNRIGEKIVGFHVSSLKRIMFKVQFVCGLFSIFKKKNKNKKTNKGRRQRQINLKILKNLFKKKIFKKKIFRAKPPWSNPHISNHHNRIKDIHQDSPKSDKLGIGKGCHALLTRFK